MSKGILMTFVVVLLFTSLILYTLEISNIYSSKRGLSEYSMHLSRLSLVSDDLSTDISDIYGVGYGRTLDYNYTFHKYYIHAMTGNMSQYFTAYLNYLPTYASTLHSNLSITIPNYTYANITCGDGIFLERDYNANSTYLYVNSSPALYNVSIVLYVDSDYLDSIPWGASPNHTPVYLKVVARNGTVVNSVFSLNKNVNNVYAFKFASGRLYIGFGDVGVGSAGIRIWGEHSYEGNLTVVMPNSSSTGLPCYYYDTKFLFMQGVANEKGAIQLVPIE